MMSRNQGFDIAVLKIVLVKFQFVVVLLQQPFHGYG